jgi:hypothetical protein
MIVIMGIAFMIGFIERVEAEEPRRKTLNLSAEQIVKVSRIVNQNKALFRDPAMLKRFIELNQALKKRDESQK